MKARLTNPFVSCSGHQPMPARVFFYSKSSHEESSKVDSIQGLSGCTLPFQRFPARQENRNNSDDPCPKIMGPGGSKKLGSYSRMPRNCRVFGVVGKVRGKHPGHGQHWGRLAMALMVSELWAPLAVKAGIHLWKEKLPL